MAISEKEVATIVDMEVDGGENRENKMLSFSYARGCCLTENAPHAASGNV